MRLGLSNDNVKNKLNDQIQKLSQCELDENFILSDEQLHSPAYRKLIAKVTVEDMSDD